MKPEVSVSRLGGLTHHGEEQVPFLFDLYRQFYGYPTDIAGVRRFLIANLAEPQVLFAVARIEGIAVGFLQAYVIPNSLTMNRLAVINDLFVDPAYRRYSCGRALLRFAQEQLVVMDVDRLELSTAVSNQAAQALYRSEGWSLDAEFVHFAKELRRSADNL